MSDQSVILMSSMHLIKSIYSEVEVNENKMKHVNNNIKVKLNDQEKQSID